MALRGTRWHILGLEQAFNSLDAQREAAEAYIASQRHEGWVCLPERYVSGYEYARGQSVVVDPEELDRLRPERERAITIDAFVAPERIDPVYHAGKTYYLVPDGPAGGKPYALLHRAMTDLGRHAIGQGVFGGDREQLALLRPLLALSVLG